MASDQPFPFLDLPAELRCMVYEHLSVETRLCTLDILHPFSKNAGPKGRLQVSLALKSLSTSILASCRFIYAEAAPILTRKLEHLRNDEPLHFIVNTLSSRYLLHGYSSIIMDIQRREQELDRQGKQARWVPEGEIGPSHVFRMSPQDDRVILLLGFINKCATYTKERRSKKIVVTVKPQHQADFQWFANAWLWMRRDWQQYRGIEECELRICWDKTEVDSRVHGIEDKLIEAGLSFTGPWHTTIRAMDSTERNEVQISGEVFELA